jgi:hypothetical protein
MTKINISLLESDAQISKLIFKELKNKLESAFKLIPNKISSPLKDIVSNALKSEPEYSSLKSGRLKYEMGIYDTSSVDKVIDGLVNTLDTQLSPIKFTSSSLVGGITITMMRSSDLGGVINSPDAYVVDSSRGYSLPWLEWLLLRGNEVIVAGHTVKIGPNSASRTGNALMIKSNGNWRVPPEFVGNEQNNWTTRALSATELSINRLIESAIRESI